MVKQTGTQHITHNQTATETLLETENNFTLPSAQNIILSNSRISKPQTRQVIKHKPTIRKKQKKK